MVPRALNNPTMAVPEVDSPHKDLDLNHHQMLLEYLHNSLNLDKPVDLPHPDPTAHAIATPIISVPLDPPERKELLDMMVWMVNQVSPEKTALMPKMPLLKLNNMPAVSTAQLDHKVLPDQRDALALVVCVELVVNPEFPAVMAIQDFPEPLDQRVQKDLPAKKVNPVRTVKMPITRLDFPELRVHPEDLGPKEMKDHVETKAQLDPKDLLVI